MEYTKGKWTHTEDGVIIADDGKQIASIFPRDREANAHLIAQSPRMAEWISKVAKQNFTVFPEDKMVAGKIIQTLDL